MPVLTDGKASGFGIIGLPNKKQGRGGVAASGRRCGGRCPCLWWLLLLFYLCYEQPAAKAAILDAGGVGACPHILFGSFSLSALARVCM